MDGDKKKQHYVWKKYLKPWTEDGKIWCRRGSAFFNTTLENVAQERYFYYAEPLNQVEYEMVLSLISRTHNSAHGTLLNDLNLYRAASENTEHQKRNALENYHDKVEHSIRDSLDRLYQKDRSFLEDEKKLKANFKLFPLGFNRCAQKNPCNRRPRHSQAFRLQKRSLASMTPKRWGM